ncbi:MAG TPA: lipopolysaccharide kinase InaA family protein [Acidobacteriota bacterium]|nr:lipopolysaccharide kinase InaA family protein [Acidobacteriota bacterium]
MGLQWLQRENSRGWFDEEFRIAPEFVRDPALFCKRNKATQILDCAARQIYRVSLPIGRRMRSCFVYIFRNLSLNRAFRLPYALRCLEVSQKLHQHGFLTFRCVAAFRPKGELLNWNSVLVATEIEEVFELPSSGNHHYPVHPKLPLSRTVTEQLAAELARFHRRGFFHGDLKTRHILVRPPASLSDHGSFRFFFVDLEKTLYLPYLPPFCRDILAVRDLIQIFASLSGQDHLLPSSGPHKAFLKSYLDAKSLSSSRRLRIQRVLSLYGPKGKLRQGDTLVRGLFASLYTQRNASDTDSSDVEYL